MAPIATVDLGRSAVNCAAPLRKTAFYWTIQGEQTTPPMPNPTPVSGPCHAPDCRRQAETSVLIAGQRVYVCERCRNRYRRHGFWKPKYRVLADEDVRRGHQLKSLGLSLTELAAHFQVSYSTSVRLFQAEPRRKRKIRS